MAGVLYIVATPIGNLGDITSRALEVLRSADVIAAEDTRHSSKLLQHFGIATPMLPYHDFNESGRALQLLGRIQQGENLALISDAGTPLVSDPGYQLVRLAHEQGIRVVPLPGASAVLAALCSAGLPTDRFTFEGFLPAKSSGRMQALDALRKESRTMVFYEAPHRILECLADMQSCFGAERRITLARELTKTYETVIHGTLAELHERVHADENQQKGEIVLVVEGNRQQSDELDEHAQHVLQTLLAELPLKQAAALAASITGMKKNLLYERALELEREKD